MNEHIGSLPKETHEENEKKVNTLRKMMDAKVLENHKLYVKVNAFGHYLEYKHPDHEDYRLFHFITGGTPPENHQCLKFDFEGDDSVEKFIRSL